jgi:plasmid stabilization system protein ParE
MSEDYDFHPEASIDLEDIWEFIAGDNPAAANRVIADIVNTIEKLVPFPHQPGVHSGAGTHRRISLSRPPNNT